jgi:glycosyltransferase involved in cell wall biosynthesis
VKEGRRRILLVSHSGVLTGAPLMLLDLAEWLVNHEGFDVATLFRAGGPLVPRFEVHGPVAVLRSRWDRELSRRVRGLSLEAAFRIRALRGSGAKFDLAYSNTLTNGRLMRTLAAHGTPILTHVHELRFGSRTYTTPTELAEVLSRTHHFVAAADCVREFLQTDLAVNAPVDVVHEFINTAAFQAEPCALEFREHLGIERDAPVVGAAGTVDWRKGDDLFVQLALRVLRDTQPELAAPHFVWLGGPSTGVERAREEARKAGIADRCHFIGEQQNPASVYRNFDVFVLPSREDAYPLVMLETGALGIPAVGFDGSGGFSEFAAGSGAVAVPYLDVDLLALNVRELLSSRDRRSRMGGAAREFVRRTSDTSIGAPKIAKIIMNTISSSASRTEP